MELHKDDQVIHYAYGLGKIVRIEEKTVLDVVRTYYAVQIGDLMVWVPDDESLIYRLRLPTPAGEFDELYNVLSGEGMALPDDRFERRELLDGLLREGSAASLCRVIRSVTNYRQNHSLDSHDQMALNRSHETLISEWMYVKSVSRSMVEKEIARLLEFNLPEKEAKK